MPTYHSGRFKSNKCYCQELCWWLNGHQTSQICIEKQITTYLSKDFFSLFSLKSPWREIKYQGDKNCWKNICGWFGGQGKKKKNQHNSVVSASKEHMKGSINPLKRYKRYKMLGKWAQGSSNCIHLRNVNFGKVSVFVHDGPANKNWDLELLKDRNV